MYVLGDDVCYSVLILQPLPKCTGKLGLEFTERLRTDDPLGVGVPVLNDTICEESRSGVDFTPVDFQFQLMPTRVA